MARGRPAAAAANRIVSGAFVFGGIFLVCFGFGVGSVAVIVAGVLLAALTMGAKITNGLRPRPRQWLPGTGRVAVVADVPPTSGEFGRCELQLTVDAPGMPTETVTVRDPRVPVAQWPQPGLLVPIEVATDNVRNVRILWQGRSVPDPVARTGDWLDDAPDPVPRIPPSSQLDSPPDPDLIDFDLDDVAIGPIEPGGPDEGRVRRSEQTVALGLPVTEPGPTGLTEAGTLSWTDAEAAALADAEPPVPAEVQAAEVQAAEVEAVVVEPQPPAEPPAEPQPSVAPVADVASVVPVRQRRRPSPYPHRSDQATRDPHPAAEPVPAAISGLGVTLIVSDLPESARFYQDKLGFQAVDGGEQTVVLAAGGTRLVLRAGDIGRYNRRLVHLNLVVEDIDAVHGELQAKGVRFISGPKVIERGAQSELWAATFRDPDGHGVALTQWRTVPEPVAPSR